MNFWRPSWRHIWRLGDQFGDIMPHYAAAAPKTIQQISGISGVYPQNFKSVGSKLWPVAWNTQTHTQTHKHTHKPTNKEHFELKVKSHYVRQ